jgi:tetratricopeptide (TPR) repeat protein
MVHRALRYAAVLALAITALAGGSVAAEEYDPNRDPQLLRCDDIYNRGDIEAAINCFQPLTRADSLHVAAEAHWALGDSRTANEYFRRAVAEQPGNPHIRARWGRLFLSTHQPSEAVPLFEEAMQLDPDYLHAQTGLVAALLTQPGAEGRQLLIQLAETHPDDVELLLLQARLALESRNLDIADRLLNRALESATKNNITPLDIYALKVSSDLLRDIDDSPWVQKALDYSPAYGDIHFIPVHYHLINYRYRESVALLKKAVEVQPTHWSAHSQLGINLLRLNDIEGAKKHLEIAYSGDPYDTATVNTLRLLETLNDFKDLDTVAQYSFNGDGTVPVVMRLHRDEATYLSPYVEALTRRAVDTFTSRYEFVLEEPLIVELFPNHDDFAVRTVSTPGVGLLGVTFGYLLAMDSPSARPAGDFHWGSTLWHELAHVFTIKKSNHRMPRWFTEGVSVYEEWTTGPLPGRHIPIDVLEAIRDNRLLPVAELDNGFVRPTYPNQVTVSYMQAGLICLLISEQWGHEKLPGMLTAFRNGEDTTEAVQSVLNISPAQLDRALDEFIERELGAIISQFDEWREIVTATNRAHQSKQWTTVIALADQANEIYPDYVGKGNVWVPLHDAYVAMGRNEAAVEALTTWYEYGGYAPDMLHQLAHRLRDNGDTGKAIEVLESINWVQPNNIDLHEKLGQDYYETNNFEGALREFKSLLGLNPHDKSVVYLNIARTYQQLGEIRLAKRNVLQALEQAPFFREAQDLLVELTGDSS